MGNIFPMAFPNASYWMGIMIFDTNFTFGPKGAINNMSQSVYNLVLDMRRTIIWTDGDQDSRHP